ncbi:MAG: hypothetical protein FJ396_14625 [Verrucomicrobia bacterium]|nr:hypothetical protein [Verrucomicrobiota bacterium]
MIETGATSPAAGEPDHVVGGSGEISRFQIMPAVWRTYTKSKNHTNPEVAWTVTRRILADRVGAFEKAMGRVPEPIEVYLLWNKPGHFEGVGYRLEKVSKTYRERAQRFQNLYNNLGGGPVSRPDLVDAPNVTSTP